MLQFGAPPEMNTAWVRRASLYSSSFSSSDSGGFMSEDEDDDD